jgi:POT family proton-dependent oligopeptide transporter
MIQNVGALASTFLCGLIAGRYGYQAGFAFAASGMVIGFFAFLLGGRLLKGLEGRPAQRIPIWWIPILGVIFVFSFFAMKFEDIALPCLPWATATVFIFFSYKLLKSQEIPKEKSRLLLLYLVGMILFFAVEDQICSSLVIFAERVSQRSIGGWAIPSSILITINPMVILLFGALIAKVRFPLSIPFFLAAFAFGLLAFFCFKHLPFSIFTMMGIVSLISIAELMVGPVIYSYASEVAAKGKAGPVMGMLPVAFSLAFLLSGKFSKMVAIDETQSTFFIYGTGFAKIALIVLLGGVVLELLKKRFTNAKRPVY